MTQQEAHEVAGVIGQEVRPLLKELRDDLLQDLAETRDEVREIGIWFRETPDQRSLPARMANLETVVVGLQAQIDRVEGLRRLTWIEHVRGGWGMAVAVIAMIGVLVGAVLTFLKR